MFDRLTRCVLSSSVQTQDTNTARDIRKEACNGC